MVMSMGMGAGTSTGQHLNTGDKVLSMFGSLEESHQAAKGQAGLHDHSPPPLGYWKLLFSLILRTY